MPFRVTARTLLHLGAELISSDAVAFYELVKNAFDAGSPRVDVDVVVRIPNDAYQANLRRALAELSTGTEAGRTSVPFAELRDEIAAAVDSTAPHAKDFREVLSQARNWEQLVNRIEEANYIDVVDTGSGMSRRQLTDVYLTIGTRARLVERKHREQEAPD